MWPILAYQLYNSKNYYDFDSQPQSHKIVFWATCVTLVFMYGLNLFWYKFIVNQVINLITGKKVVETPGADKLKEKKKD